MVDVSLVLLTGLIPPIGHTKRGLGHSDSTKVAGWPAVVFAVAVESLLEPRRVARIDSVAAAAVIHSAPRSGPLAIPIPATPNPAPSQSLPLPDTPLTLKPVVPAPGSRYPTHRGPNPAVGVSLRRVSGLADPRSGDEAELVARYADWSPNPCARCLAPGGGQRLGKLILRSKFPICTLFTSSKAHSGEKGPVHLLVQNTIRAT